MVDPCQIYKHAKKFIGEQTYNNIIRDQTVPFLFQNIVHPQPRIAASVPPFFLDRCSEFFGQNRAFMTSSLFWKW